MLTGILSNDNFALWKGFSVYHEVSNKSFWTRLNNLIYDVKWQQLAVQFFFTYNVHVFSKKQVA